MGNWENGEIGSWDVTGDDIKSREWEHFYSHIPDIALVMETSVGCLGTPRVRKAMVCSMWRVRECR